MGHLAIVNSNTILNINDANPYVSITGTLGSLGYKTLSDLFSDALAVRKGDKIFTWMINGGSSAGIGFDRYYIANGDVVFDSNDEYPIKIGISSGMKYQTPVSEEEALNLFRNRLLWNAIGKKSLGRGRGLSHQTLSEDELLVELLQNKNLNIAPTPILTAPSYGAGLQPISISNFGVNNNEVPIKGTPIKGVNIGGIVWNKGNKFRFEKTLEAFLCEHIDNPQYDILDTLGYPGYSVKWFGNYLPYGVAGRNIDFVVEISNGNDFKVLVIELKAGKLSHKKYQDIAQYQVLRYAEFIKNAYNSFGRKVTSVDAVVLSALSTVKPANAPYDGVKWLGYEVADQSVNFFRIL